MSSVASGNLGVISMRLAEIMTRDPRRCAVVLLRKNTAWGNSVDYHPHEKNVPQPPDRKQIDVETTGP